MLNIHGDAFIMITNMNDFLQTAPMVKLLDVLSTYDLPVNQHLFVIGSAVREMIVSEEQRNTNCIELVFIKPSPSVLDSLNMSKLGFVADNQLGCYKVENEEMFSIRVIAENTSLAEVLQEQTLTINALILPIDDYLNIKGIAEDSNSNRGWTTQRLVKVLSSVYAVHPSLMAYQNFLNENMEDLDNQVLRLTVTSSKPLEVERFYETVSLWLKLNANDTSKYKWVLDDSVLQAINGIALPCSHSVSTASSGVVTNYVSAIGQLFDEIPKQQVPELFGVAMNVFGKQMSKPNGKDAVHTDKDVFWLQLLAEQLRLDCKVISANHPLVLNQTQKDLLSKTEQIFKVTCNKTLFANSVVNLITTLQVFDDTKAFMKVLSLARQTYGEKTPVSHYNTLMTIVLSQKINDMWHQGSKDIHNAIQEIIDFTRHNKVTRRSNKSYAVA